NRVSYGKGAGAVSQNAARKNKLRTAIHCETCDRTRSYCPRAREPARLPGDAEPSPTPRRFPWRNVSFGHGNETTAMSESLGGGDGEFAVGSLPPARGGCTDCRRL